MATSGTTPVIVDLAQALSQPLTGPRPNVSRDILAMFRVMTDFSKPVHNWDTLAYQRFDKARALYQRVKNNGATEAVFYRIDDRTVLENEYKNALNQINNEFKGYIVFLGGPPNLDEITNFFNQSKNYLQHKIPQTEHDRKMIEVIDSLATVNATLLTTTADPAISNYWFDSNKNRVNQIAEQKFYQVVDINNAYDQGTIYGPGSDHNWGVNVAWALAVAEKNIPVRLLSELDMRNAERSHPSANPTTGRSYFPENPSAFSLEIAIAKKMGYELTFGPTGPTLTPPVVPKPVPFTTGKLGNGVLPTKTGQLDVFKECVLRQIHHDGNFPHHVQAICTGVDNNAKQSLINTLQFMQSQESTVLPMLNDLSLAQSNQLKTTLNDPSFNHTKYNRLKTAVEAVQLQKIHQNGNLLTHVLAVCKGADNGAKHNLVNSLQLLQAQGSAAAMLNDLSLRECNQLKAVLGGMAFNEPKYNGLKGEVTYFQNDKIRSIRNYVGDTCTTGDGMAKQQLLDRLSGMDVRDRVMILSALTPPEKNALHSVLTNDFRVGYDNLRAAVAPRLVGPPTGGSTSKKREEPSSSMPRIGKEPETKKRRDFK